MRIVYVVVVPTDGTLFFRTQLTNYMDVSRYMDEKFSGASDTRKRARNDEGEVNK